MRKINLRQIEAFHALIRTGTVTQAGNLLGITQPAVSRLISELELQVGLRLFERDRGRLRPTPEAQSLFNEIERTYVGLDHLANFIEGLGRVSGHLRLLATMPMAHVVAPAVMMSFRKNHPDIIFTLKTVLSRDIQFWLDSQQFDIALTNFPIDYPTTATLPLAHVGSVCVFPASHPLAAAGKISARALAGMPFIAAAPETQQRHKIDQCFARENVKPDLVIEVQTGILVCEFVAAGLGVGIVDAITAHGFLAKKVLSRPFVPGCSFEFRMLFPIQRARSRLVTEFAQCAAAIVPKIGFPISRRP